MNILSSYDQEQQEEQQSILNSIEHECDQCFKVFASKYGLDYHQNMHHAIFCSNCKLTFRSHRALKNHQQHFHLISSDNHLPNYNHISSYLIVPFSTEQFSYMATYACEQRRLPLGEFTSKLFPCQFCSLSFPSMNGLKYHRLNTHEQYQYDLCRNILYEIILQVEENSRTVMEEKEEEKEIQTMKFLLAKQASHFGLIDKQLAREARSMKSEHHRLIFPRCEHQNRTCANLCLQNLSSYNQLIRNYSYKIPKQSKGDPFAQGSIVSNPSIPTFKETINGTHKRSSFKRIKSSSQSKRKLTEQSIVCTDQSSSTPTTPKKPFLKITHNYTRSLSSMSSTSSTSTRSSSKNSRQHAAISLKRSISPTIALAVERSSEKRRRQREQRKAKALSSSSSSSSNTTKIPDDIEQENDDDEIILINSKKPKQRQASTSSIEYVQIINNDPPSISSLNNIENFKLKSPSNDDDIIICHHSSSSIKKAPINGVHKITNHQTTEYDEQVRVRCKICGDILDGRSRFSAHVLTMHSHLIKNNLSDIKQQQQQQQQQTTMVYSV